MFILTKKSDSGRTKYTHTIHSEDISRKSYANSLLLHDYYKRMDDDYLSAYDLRMLKIEHSRKTLFDWQTKLDGKLFCVYCSKEDLQIEFDGLHITPNVKATLEHLIPISKGGEDFNLNHIVCACGKCNGSRSNKDLPIFLNARGISKESFNNRCQIYFNLNK